MISPLIDMVTMVGIWEKIPHLGQCPPNFAQHLIEGVSLGHVCMPLRELILDHPTLDVGIPTLDVELLDDDVMC